MTTETTQAAPELQQTNPDPTPSEETQRVANAFEDRLKAVAPVEVAPPDPVVPKETEAVLKSDDEIPAHIIEGTEAPKAAAVAKDPEVDAITPPAKMTQAQTHSWGGLRTLAETRGAEIKRLAGELEASKAVKTDAPDPKAGEAVIAAQARIAELEQELERSAFERSTRFKALVGESQDALEYAKSYIKDVKVDGEFTDETIIDTASRVSGSKRLQVLRAAGLDEGTVAAVSAALAQFDMVGKRKESALAQQKVIQAQWQQQEQARTAQDEARVKADEMRVFDQVGERVTKSFASYQKVDGNEKWNAQVDVLRAEAKEFFNGSLPLDKTAEIAYAGVAYKVEHRMNEVLREQLKAERAKNAKLTVAQPDGGNGAPRAATASNNALDNSQAAVAARFEAALGR